MSLIFIQNNDYSSVSKWWYNLWSVSLWHSLISHSMHVAGYLKFVIRRLYIRLQYFLIILVLCPFSYRKCSEHLPAWSSERLGLHLVPTCNLCFTRCVNVVPLQLIIRVGCTNYKCEQQNTVDLTLLTGQTLFIKTIVTALFGLLTACSQWVTNYPE